jgi:hypothetical protein
MYEINCVNKAQFLNFMAGGILLLFSTYALQPSRLTVRYGLDVPTYATRRPHASPRKSTQRRKVKLWAKNVPKFCLNADFHVTFRDLLHAVKLRHGTDGLYFHSEGRRAEDFFTLKIQRLRPGVNPRTWVPKASTLPRDHRSCLQNLMNYRSLLKPLCFGNSLLCLHHEQKPTLLVAYNHFLKPWTLNGHGPTAHILSK